MLLAYRKQISKMSPGTEKSSYYQRVLMEERLRTFFFGHHSRQSTVANSSSGKMATARYRIRYCF